MAEPQDPYAGLHPDLQTALIDAWHLLPRTETVGANDSFRDLYTLIDYVTCAVQIAFPDIPCKSGCAHCCIDYGLPRTTAREWEAIHRYMRDAMAPDVRRHVIAKARLQYGGQVPALLVERQRVQFPHTDPRAHEQELPSFTCLECPLLVDNRCTVYPVRPAICRAFGSFSVRVGDALKAFTCRMAADHMQTTLATKGIPHWALPVWGKFEERLYVLNDGYGDIASLPLWLLAHIESDDLVLTVDLAPDFSALVPASRADGTS